MCDMYAGSLKTKWSGRFFPKLLRIYFNNSYTNCARIKLLGRAESFSWLSYSL
jgi:hypothetical protein